MTQRIRKKYIIHPGTFNGMYVSCHQVAKQNNVNIKECFLDMGEHSMKGVDQEAFKHLYPKDAPI